MRSLHVFLICALALVAGCATKPQVAAATAPTAPKVVPPRSDCPRGYVMVSNSRGTACWPAGNAAPPAEHCKPLPWPNTGYMLWTCPVPVPARDARGNLEIEEAIEASARTDTEKDEFYQFVRQYLHDYPSGGKDPAHLRYHGYYGLADQFSETPSDTLMEDGRSRALASEPWFESTVLSDIEHCDADLARTAMRMAVHFTRRGALKGIVKVQRFRDVTLPEEVRLALLRAWLNAVAGMYDDRAKAAKVHGPVLDELETSDPSPLIRQAVPLYRNMLANSTCCGLIHWPNDRPAPVDAQGLIRFDQDPLGRIYEPEDAWPLPEPHEGGVHKGTCPPSS